MGESVSLANETCVPVGQADWGREERGMLILVVKLSLQLDKPTGGKAMLGEQKRLVEMWCRYQILNTPAQAAQAAGVGRKTGG